MRPLRVSAQLGAPVIGGDYSMPLDGILLALAMQRLHGFPDAFLPGRAVEFDPAIVPLQILNPGDDWFYAASFARWDFFTEGSDYWNKRLDDYYAESHANKNKVDIGSGAYKSYHSQVFYRHAESISWYVVGEQREIVSLLNDCTYIGKKTAHGWGHVLQWGVVPVDEDYSVMFDGNPSRAVPAGYFETFSLNWNLGQRAIRPPYWASENVRMTYVP